MAKESGLGWTRLEVDNTGGSAQELKNDVGSFEFALPIAVQEVTGIDMSAYERLPLLRDFSITLNFPAWNDDANRVFAVLSTIPTNPGPRTVGMTVSGQILNNECLFTSFDWSRGDDGKFSGKSTAVLANGTIPAWS
jgi:hypothetical protein